MSDRDYGDPQEPTRRRAFGLPGWTMGALVVLLLLIGALALLAQRGEMKSADNTPGAKSSVNSPPPSAPREREPQAGR